MKTLAQRYPSSKPCGCAICLAYCKRPGWWSVEEAAKALDAGLGNRMMLELAPEMTFAVLSPAFKGNEGLMASNIFADMGCTFLMDNKCELHGTGHQPLECRFCHHDRRGLGPRCHHDLEKDWNTPAGQEVVRRWLGK